MTKYWENLELSFDPFDRNEEVEPCFLSEQALYLLDLITQLSRHSHASLLVLAPAGGGKTTLAKAFVNKLGASGVCQISGNQSITIEFLRFLLAKHLGIHYIENQPEQFNKQLAKQLEIMAKNRQKFYIVIDDAHVLPERTLAGLLTLASRQPHEFPPLHMVFFGGLPLETTVSDVVLRQNLDLVTHTSRIKAFDRNTTKHYISHCLRVAGYAGDFPLTDSEVEQIHSDADGLPGLINQEVVSYFSQKRVRARNAIKTIKPSDPSNSPVPSKAADVLHVGKKKIIGAVGLFALIAVAFMVVNHPIKLPTATTNTALSTPSTESKLAYQTDNLQPQQPKRLAQNAIDAPKSSIQQSERPEVQQLPESSVAKASHETAAKAPDVDKKLASVTPSNVQTASVQKPTVAQSDTSNAKPKPAVTPLA